MSYLTVPNLKKYQHYKDRSPPWIKLHSKILDNYKFECLQDASKSHLMLIWLLASRTDNKIRNDTIWIGRKIGANSPINLKELIEAGFLNVIGDVADCKQDASIALALARSQEGERETEREAETERERETEEDGGGGGIGKNINPHQNREDIFLSIPVDGDLTHDITNGQADAYQTTFKEIDVNQALQELKLWNAGATHNRQSMLGMPQHIFSWLKREQQSAIDRQQKEEGVNEDYLDETLYPVTSRVEL